MTPDAVTLEQIDVVIEVTGSIEYGASATLAALEAGRNVVSLNAEVDATIGYLLPGSPATTAWSTRSPTATNQEACSAPIPGSGPWGSNRSWSANCKRHLDRFQNPTTSAPYAERDGTSAEITTAAGDGTKLQIECAVVANVTGFEPDCRGMHGVPTTLERAVDDLRAIESHDHVVEYTLGGDFGAGVFVVGRTHDHDAVARSLRFYKMGSGPDYLFFRPSHARTVRDGRDDRRCLDQRPCTGHAGGATGGRSRHDGEA